MTRKQLYSTEDVAEILGISTSTLARWRRAGEPNLPYRRLGDRIFYRSSDVQQFIDDMGRDGELGADDEEVDEEVDEEEDPT